jgi:hypothetical protein
MNQSGRVHLGGGAPSSGDFVRTRRRRWDIPTVKINGAMGQGRRLLALDPTRSGQMLLVL